MARIDHYRDGKWVRSLELLQRSYLVGRDPAADLVLDGPLCSRRHLQLNWVGGAFVMEDLDTSNGTIVDGVREYNRRLSSNATTQIGVDLLLFRPDAEGTAPPEDDELPGWAFKGLDEATLTLSATGQMAPAELAGRRQTANHNPLPCALPLWATTIRPPSRGPMRSSANRPGHLRGST